MTPAGKSVTGKGKPLPPALGGKAKSREAADAAVSRERFSAMRV
jgi:hypothetical protein